MCTGILSIPVDVFVEKNINEGMYIKRHLANSCHIEANFHCFRDVVFRFFKIENLFLHYIYLVI